MKIYIKKSLTIVLAIIFVISLNTAYASAQVIYETSSRADVAKGVSLEKITRFTDEGWLNIEVLSVEYGDGIRLDTISNPDSLKNVANVKALAESKGAVAAVNGCFFNYLSGGGYPDGPIVESGKLITAASDYNKYNNSMASFSIDNANQLSYDYWKTDITLTSSSGAISIGQYNKPSRDYNDFTILDRKWSEGSIGVSKKYPDIVEMLVENGVVSEIRIAQPEVTIPLNGYVVITRGAGGQALKSKFKVGDRVKMKINTTPDWNKLKMSMTGSAMLVKDGAIPAKFSFEIGGRHPRTAVGSTSDGKKLFLVTVDGKQKSSIGMTQGELAKFMLAKFMLELGAYNALNFDGGGSTTMVTRKLGTDVLQINNTPSDGAPRGVTNAVGVFSDVPRSELDSLLIDAADTNIFNGTSRKFSVKGLDKNLNPVEVNQDDVIWSVSGVEGSFTAGRFFPKSTGSGKVSAAIGSAQGEVYINVLSSPVMLELSGKKAALKQGDSKSIGVSGKNSDGFHAVIDPTDLNWSVTGQLGTVSDGIFHAMDEGNGYIDVSLSSIHAYYGILVNGDGSSASLDTLKVPADTEPVDDAKRAAAYIKGSDSFRFCVIGQSGAPVNLLEKLLYQRFSETANSFIDVSAFVGSTTDDITGMVKTPTVSTSNQYKSFDIKNSRFIQLDSSKQGLRVSSEGQWKWFLEQLEGAKGSNIFIFLQRSQWSFTDKQETSLFQNVLEDYRKKTGKNIWVFFNRTEDISYMERGIKYISISGFDSPRVSTSNMDAAKYMLVTVEKDSVTYQYRPIVQ